MTLYYFDFLDGNMFTRDDIGMECDSLEAAKVEASAGLIGYAKDNVPGSDEREIAVEVRTESAPVLVLKMSFKTKQLVP